MRSVLTGIKISGSGGFWLVFIGEEGRGGGGECLNIANGTQWFVAKRGSRFYDTLPLWVGRVQYNALRTDGHSPLIIQIRE